MEREENTPQEKTPTTTISILFGILMIVVYCGMAYLMIFSSIFNQNLPEYFRYIAGVLLFLYGIFRYSDPYSDINTPDILSRLYPELAIHCLATSYTKEYGFFPKAADRAPIFQLPAVRHRMSAFFTAALRFWDFRLQTDIRFV